MGFFGSYRTDLTFHISKIVEILPINYMLSTYFIKKKIG